jgi:hypothetical protein
MGGWNGTGKDNKGDMSLVEVASSNPKVYYRIYNSLRNSKVGSQIFSSPQIENLQNKTKSNP